MAVFAARDLKQWREAQKISAAELAEEVNCDVTTIYRYERGQLKPNPDVMYQICEFLGDIRRWRDWMRTEYPTSYGRVHPDNEVHLCFIGASSSAFAEMKDVLALEHLVQKDISDGKIDDAKLKAQYKKEVAEALAACQRLLDYLNGM